MITRDEWLKALGESVKPSDPDSLTLDEIRQQFAIGRQAAALRMRTLVEQRQAVKTWKLVGTRRVPSYKIVTKAHTRKRR